MVGMPAVQGCATSKQHTALTMVVAAANSAELVQCLGTENWQLPSSRLAIEAKLFAAVCVQPS
jgi:hypothetical protein